MERKLKPIQVQSFLEKKGLRLFSPDEFRRFFNVTPRAAQEFTKDHKEDLFVKLRNGLYALRSDPPHELEIANRLYQPSYVSLEYALAYHGMIPETVYAVTSVTTKITRSFTAEGRKYDYSRIKRRAYTGYRLYKRRRLNFWMASPEKALVDYVYYVDLKLRSMNDRIRIGETDVKEALRLAHYFSRPSLLKRIRELYD